MTYTDKHGRHELVMSLDIACGDADYRVVPAPDATNVAAGGEEQGRTSTPRRAPSPVRTAAATRLSGDQPR